MTKTRIALATATAAKGRDDDERPLLAALAEAGIEAKAVVWDDPAVSWQDFALVVLRSTWNYSRQRERFVEWVESVAEVSSILNKPPVVRWNTNKLYLRELDGAGVPTVPTTFVLPGESFALPQDAEVVVKPVISAGAKDTARYADSDAAGARAHADRLLADGRAVMIQPYQKAVDSAGETAVIHLGGVYSHSARKGPILMRGNGLADDLFAPEEITPREPSGQERAVASRALEALPFAASDLLYARVDLVPGDDDAPRVLEVELTEPSLFLDQGEGAALRLAAAIVRRL